MTIDEMKQTVKVELQKAFKGSYEVFESDNGDLFNDDEQYAFEAVLEKNITAAVAYLDKDDKWRFCLAIGDLDSNWDVPTKYESKSENLALAIEKAIAEFKGDYKDIVRFYNSLI